jgi:hypothetical protein
MSYASEQSVLNGQWNAAEMAFQVEVERARPFYLLRPKVYPDGDQWCALYGDNLQEGVAGFGDTPALAAYDFDKNWNGQRLHRALDLARQKEAGGDV